MPHNSMMSFMDGPHSLKGGGAQKVLPCLEGGLMIDDIASNTLDWFF